MRNRLDYGIGCRIETRRSEIGMNRETVAEALGICPLELGLVECGQKTLTIHECITLSEILATSTDFILTGREQSQPIQDNSEQLTALDMIKVAEASILHAKELLELQTME